MDQIPALDIAALIWFAAATFGYKFITSRPALLQASIAGRIQHHRLAWMRIMSRRDSRIVDAQLLMALSHGNAFFASTSAIAIGGLAAMSGSGDKVIAFLDRIPYAAQTTPFLWELKIVLLIGVFVFAFFSFAWAFRLSHYTAIMIGATPLPEEGDAVTRERHAERTARLIGIAAEHANSGLRSFYFAMAAMAWLLHPIAFILATTWIVGILTRRDYFSRSRALLAEDE